MNQAAPSPRGDDACEDSQPGEVLFPVSPTHDAAARPMTAAVHRAFARADVRSQERLQLQGKLPRTRSPIKQSARNSTSVSPSKRKPQISNNTRPPLFFRAADGVLKNLAAGGDDAGSVVQWQEALEVPESSPEGAAAVHLPLLFRGRIAHAVHDSTRVSSQHTGDARAHDNRGSGGNSRSNTATNTTDSNKARSGRKTRKHGHQSKETTAEQLLATLQSLPRPSTVPHKPLQFVSSNRNTRTAGNNSSSSSSPQRQAQRNETFWAPSSISGMAHLRPTTPMQWPVRSREQTQPFSPAAAPAAAAASDGKKTGTQKLDVARRDDTRPSNRTHVTTHDRPRMTTAQIKKYRAQDAVQEYIPDDFSDTRSDVASVVELRKHEPTLRPSALQHAMARGTVHGFGRDETTDVSGAVSKVMRQSGATIMKRKHEARSAAHKMASVMDDDIKAIRSTLPVSFLFEHNMSEFVFERGLDKIRGVIQRIRMRAVAVAWLRWRQHTEAEAEKAIQAKLLHLQAMHGRDRMIGFMKRMLNSKVQRQFEFWRDRCAAVVQRDRVHAAERIRRAWRANRARCVLAVRISWRRNRAAVRIQTVLGRGPGQKEKLVQLRLIRSRHLAAPFIQRHWRAYAGRRAAVAQRRAIVRSLQRRWAAFFIQGQWRGSKGREFVENLKMRHARATVIQRHTRGYWGRRAGTALRTKVFKQALAILREALEMSSREAAAVAIQNVFRNFLVAQEVMRVVDVIREAHACAAEAMRAVERQVAAVGIQRAFVRSAAKASVFGVLDEVVQFIQERTLVGSIRIQRMARKHRGRRLVRAWRARFVLETDRATAIEAWVRSVWGRRFARKHRAELTHLQVLLAGRWRARCYARLRRRVMKRWAIGRRGTLMRSIDTWKHSAATIKSHRKTQAWMNKFVTAARFHETQKYRWVVRLWLEWLTEWKELCRKRRKAYAMWRNAELRKGFLIWNDKVAEREELRVQLRIVFMQVTHLTHWNSMRQQPLVRRANKVRYRDIWGRWGVFTDWRKNLWRDACEHHARVFWAYWSRAIWDGWQRHVATRRYKKAQILKGEAHCIRYRKSVGLALWNAHRERRRRYLRVLVVADKAAARKRQRDHVRAWHRRAAFQTVMKRNAKKAMGYLRNGRTVKSFRMLALNAKQRQRARKVVDKLLYSFARRETELPFVTWKANAEVMTFILKTNAMILVQRYARIWFARRKVSRLIRGRKYKFERAVQDELGVHVLEPENIDAFLRRWDIVVVHYYIPWDDTPERREAFARGGAWLRDEAKKWLRRHTMCTPRETTDDWGNVVSELVQKCVFAKANVAALDSQDYGRSLGVRMNVPVTPTIRMYWRWGRGDKIGPAESSKSFSWVPEDYPIASVKLLGDVSIPRMKFKFDHPLVSISRGGPTGGAELFDWVCNKCEHVLQVETRAQVLIARWSRGHIARAVIVPARKAEVYWDKQPLWVQQVNKRTGETEYYNRISGQTTADRPDVYVTPRDEGKDRRTALEMLDAADDGELPTALQYKKAVICMVCQEDLASWKCLDTCDVPMCDRCTETSHRGGAFSSHKCVAVDAPAMHKNKRMCGECEVRCASLFCIQCLDTYCRECYGDSHMTGRRQFHKYTLMSEKNAMRVPKDKRDQLVSTKAQDIIERRGWKTLHMLETEHAERQRNAAAKKARMDEFRDVVKEAFDKFDEDGSGTMEIDELEAMLSHELREPVPEEELQTAIQEMDADGNGVVDFEEFLDWFTSEKVKNRTQSWSLKAMRFRLKARAVTKNSLNAAEERARRAARMASQRIEDAKAKARAKYDHAAARAKEAREKIYAKMPERFRKAYEAPPRVPNTSVRPIDVTAFDRLQPVFMRWTKEKFLLNIPYHGFLNRRKAIDAFEEVFVPAWNNGELDVWHYHDGRRFTIPKGKKTDFTNYVQRKKDAAKAAEEADERARKRERERIEAKAEKEREAKRRAGKRRERQMRKARGEVVSDSDSEGEGDEEKDENQEGHDELKSVSSDQTGASGDSAGSSKSSGSSGSSASSGSSSGSESSDESTAFDEDTEVWEQSWNDGQGQFEYRRIDPETNEAFPSDTKGGLGEMLLYDPLHAEQCREEAENAFRAYDLDGTGQLDGEEIAKLLESELCTPVRARTLKGFMLEVDEDHDGTIDFDEFFKWYVKETDENGMNAKWSRTVETRAMKLAFKSRKMAKVKAKESVVWAKKSFVKAIDKFKDVTASKELKTLTREYRYPREAALKALAMKRNRVDEAVAWLKANDIKPMPKIAKKKTKKQLAKQEKLRKEEEERERLEAEDDY